MPAKNLYDAQGQAGRLDRHLPPGRLRDGDRRWGRAWIRGSRSGRPRTGPAISEIHQAAQATNPQIHPGLKEGEACVTWEGQIESEAAGDYDLPDVRQQRPAAWLDGKLVVDN